MAKILLLKVGFGGFAELRDISIWRAPQAYVTRHIAATSTPRDSDLHLDRASAPAADTN